MKKTDLTIVEGNEAAEAELDPQAEGGEDEAEFDFGSDSVFTSEAEVEQIPVPGREDQYLRVRVVDDGTEKGLTRFTKNVGHYGRDQRGKPTQIDSVSFQPDAAGLALYKRRSAIVGFRLVNGKSGQVVEYRPDSPAQNELVYQLWTGKFGRWVDSQIDRVNGWDEAGKGRRERFPAPAAASS